MTDSDDPPAIRRGEDKPGVTNLIDLLAACAAARPTQVERDMQDARGYGDLKAAVAEAVIAELDAGARALRRAAARRGGARGGARARRRAGARDRLARRSPTCATAMGVGPARRTLTARRRAPSASRQAADAAAARRRSSARCPRRHAALRRAGAVLPALEHEFSLSKAQAGVARRLVSGRHVARGAAGRLRGGALGPRPVVLAGLGLMTSRASSSRSPGSIATLDLARFCQGLGGAATWTAGLAWLGAVAPRERRGEALGYAIGAGIFGAQFGPVVGAVADALGRGPTFAAVAALGIVLAAWAARQDAPRRRRVGDGGRAATLARDRAFLAAAWLTFLPSLAFGVAEVLVPLRLDELGAGRARDRRGVPRRGARRGRDEPARGPRRRPPRRARDRARRDVRRRRPRVALLAVPASALGVAALLVADRGRARRAVDAERQPRIAAAPSSSASTRAGRSRSTTSAGRRASRSAPRAGGALGQLVGDGLPYGALRRAARSDRRSRRRSYGGAGVAAQRSSDPERPLRSTP